MKLLKEIILISLIMISADSMAQSGKEKAEKIKKEKTEKVKQNSKKEAERIKGEMEDESEAVIEELEDRVKKEVTSKGQKDKPKKDKPEKEENDDESSDETTLEDKEKKEKSNNGNAYGKDKKGLEGKDFGQNRAEAAKAKKAAEAHKEETEKALNDAVTNGDEKVKQAKEKIKQAKEKLEKERADGEITEEEYQAKKAKIDQAEKLTIALEEKLNNSKKVVQSP